MAKHHHTPAERKKIEAEMKKGKMTPAEMKKMMDKRGKRMNIGWR